MECNQIKDIVDEIKEELFDNSDHNDGPPLKSMYDLTSYILESNVSSHW